MSLPPLRIEVEADPLDDRNWVHVDGSSDGSSSQQHTADPTTSDGFLGITRPRRSIDGSGLGGSIRRKLREVKDASARSFKRRPSSVSRASESAVDSDCSANGSQLFGPWENGKKREYRSQSEVLSTRPYVHHNMSSSSISAARQADPLLRSSPSPPKDSPRQKFEDVFIDDDDQVASSAAELSSTLGVAQDSTMLDVTVPQLLQQGVPMLKVSAKKQKRVMIKLDPDQGQIVWESKKHRIIPIENIKELRAGADARYYREQFQLAPQFEDRWLTVVYVLDGGYKTLHLIASTRDVFQMWDTTLRGLYAIRQKLGSELGHTEVRQAVWEKQFWRSAATETDADQLLDFAEVERMCRRLNIHPAREELLREFQQADSQHRGYLDFTDFQRFVKALKRRPEVEALYIYVTKDSGGALTYHAFENFMRSSQKSSLGRSELERIFLRYATTFPDDHNSSPPSSPPQRPLDLAARSPTPSSQSLGQASSSAALPTVPITPTLPSASVHSQDEAWMTLKGFTTFLLSTDNSAFSDQHGKVYHDMTQPLPDYFISSSHNTYLVGHQLVGESTIEGYIRALLHSCRSVELDIYDSDAEPVVYHGHTLTSKVSLRDACTAINKYAFVASPYPIIISAEIHCSVPQQDMIASIMQEVFGDALVCAPIDGTPQIETLPSPEDLKGRVLLKAKNLFVTDKDSKQEREAVSDAESSSTENISDLDLAEDSRRRGREFDADIRRDLRHEFQRARTALVRAAHSPPPALSRSPRHNAYELPPSHRSPSKTKMSMALAALLVYTIGVKCRGLNKKEVYAPEHMFSLSENMANRILKQGMTDLIKHNRMHLVRIYPKGTRIGSTNFEPHRFWSAGAQLVAINWQTFDMGYMINHAMFQRNGRVGYVLKPLALRTSDKQLLVKHTSHRLDVVIISAQQLPRPKDSQGREIIDKSVIDPYVEVSIHVPDWPQSPGNLTASRNSSRVRSPSKSPGPSGDSQRTATPARTVAQRTGVVKNNGFNPVWKHPLSIPFDLAGDMRDLVFVRFAVRQDGASDDEPLAVYCASLGSLNMGYRHLPLHDAQLSQYLFSTLFVRLNVRTL
ncbi:uncharacterized protein FIBRA_01396 [Fibroporia radiculosa]|uniref:Phosphoinositide phospholipase C n=1 Tax=Fibroporia radiculosa TaxID=599839 RepID=J4G0Y8_9APHY|nr:uncharacterized protein FIBRA_01396 [Fibroporia radiculosa]CCL99378.1 predicted protein [Fibroporia radiculosa]